MPKRSAKPLVAAMTDPAGVATSSQVFEHWRQRVDAALLHALPPASDLPLYAAMRHAVLLGGKRMRPLLVYAAGELCGAAEDALDAPAVAVELIHAYSLVHDDLPAMDDDALRRGQPTVHVAFDEATAILAGDALQTLAFAQLANAATPTTADAAQIRLDMVRELAVAAGMHGMCGGQALDIDATGRRGDIALADLERLQAWKTGALLRAAVRMGAIAGGADAGTRNALDDYANALGLAFQIRDDLLDIEADSATLGKTAGKDVAQGKATFPALLGVDGSRLRLHQLETTMRDALAPFGSRAHHLHALAEHAVRRDR